ncbi:hypothetical protein [Italian clover phyllody phytoplasma]|uniref:hypothetical protein n=1 Tax=Italian clover phyllody phytoplasma TaxID=1196420 RepID=UPI000313D036|nr:hypothetical protein [Italian clover phyllody phytoplasma]
MFKKQDKKFRLNIILKNVDPNTVKIVVFKNLDRKTHFKDGSNILFVNPNVLKMVEQFLQEKRLKQNKK